MFKSERELSRLMKNMTYEDIDHQLNDILEYNNLDTANSDEYNDNFDRMKLKIMRYIKISSTRRILKASLLAAVITLCLLVSAFTPFGRRTLADIIEKLYFIPGAGKAETAKEDDVYVLPKPIYYNTEKGSIVIQTATKQADYVAIYLTGEFPVYSNNITIEFNKRIYKYSRSVTGIGSNNIGEFLFAVPDTADSFVLNINDQYRIPIELKKVEGFQDYKELGPTSIVNGFGLTLVPNRIDDKIQFHILEHQVNSAEVALYGSCDKEAHDNIHIEIEDNYENNYSVEYPKAHSGTQSSFSFTPEDNATSFTVRIPEVTLKYNLDNKLELPMPKEGETKVNIPINLHGFPITITKIIRKDKLVTLYTDTNYSTDANENINYFILDMDAMSIDYYHYKLNDKITTEAFEFYINPDKKKLVIHFKELYTTLKGPWSFEINNLP